MRLVASFGIFIHSHSRKHMVSAHWSSCIWLAAANGSSRLAAFYSPCCTRILSSSSPQRVSQVRLCASSSLKQEKSDEDIEKETMEWVRRVVVGWNLCPFADGSVRQGALRLETVRGSDEQTILGAVLGEMLVRKDVPGTTLVIAPECHPNDFSKYLEFVNAIEHDFMEEYDLHGHVQVAPFHPLFEFEGSGTDGIDNYTNRAPYPIFHVLREEEVESAVARLGGDASRVWKRNVELLKDMKDTLGSEEAVKDAIQGKRELKQKVDEVLRRHRFKVDQTDETTS